MTSTFLPVLTVYHESEAQVRWHLDSYRRVYPQQPLLMIDDGSGNPRWPQLAQEYGVQFRGSQRLKGLESGALWWQRFFLMGLEADGDVDYLVKVDPDTTWHRPLRYLPSAGFFGCVLGQGPLLHVQGGFQGFNHAAARQILDSHEAEKPAYRDTRHWAWGPAGEGFWRGNRQMSTDWTIKKIAITLGIPMTHYDEVNSHWHVEPANPEQRYAVTHPHKLNAGPMIARAATLLRRR